jgi:hypothetical protein
MLSQDVEVGLRDAMTRVASEVQLPAGLAERVRGREYKVQGNRKAIAAMTVASVAVVALGAGAPLALSVAHWPSAGGTTVRLASFSLRLPRGYHKMADPAPDCGLILDYVWPFQPTPTSPPAPPDMVSQQKMVVSQPKIATAVDKAGGCVYIAASWTFTPGTGAGPQIFPTPSYRTALHIDGYHGWIGSVDWAQLPGPHQLWVVPKGGFEPWPTGTEQVLDLTVPDRYGQVQDFTVAAKGISQPELVSIVSSGLALSSVPRTATTSGAGG